VATGKHDEVLMFMNGHLICDETSIAAFEAEDNYADDVYGEIKKFVRSVDGVITKTYKEWNGFSEKWVECNASVVSHLDTITSSYENAITALVIKIDHELEDEFDCYTYNFAHTIENPLVIKNKQWAPADGLFVPVEEYFVPYTNTLQVWLNGVKLHNNLDRLNGTAKLGFVESPTGDGFYLPAEYYGQITYVLERPEKGETKSFNSVLLTRDNLMNTPNVYRSPISLYPGWVTLYVNGIRMSNESFLILDNYTIKFKDPVNQLIGHSSNYPIKTVIKDKDPSETVDLPFTDSDVVLVEVRQKYDKNEKTFTLHKPDNQEINVVANNIPSSILEANDEIMIFINGLFTGYKDNVEYRKELQKGTIALLSNRFSQLINYDPLYTYLALNPQKMAKWQLQHGAPYEPKIKNVITLEWR
jgi:hypothetical protein